MLPMRKPAKRAWTASLVSLRRAPGKTVRERPSARLRELALLWLASSTALVGVPLPTINTNNIVTVADPAYSAVGDATTTNTSAIQSAISAASAGPGTNGLIGGTVRIPAGTFLSGPLALLSSVNLQLDPGATLRMLPFGQYPLTYFTNATNRTITWTAPNFITASSAHNIETTGPRRTV